MEIDYSYYALIGGAYYQYTYYTPNESYAVYVMNNFIFKQVKGEELKIYIYAENRFKYDGILSYCQRT